MVLTTLRDLFGFIQLKAVAEEPLPTDDVTASVRCCESLARPASVQYYRQIKLSCKLTGSQC